MSTLRDYYLAVNSAMNEHWRKGQTYFNVLLEFKEGLAERVRGDNYLDPFHKDDNLPTFINFIEVNWYKENLNKCHNCGAVDGHAKACAVQYEK